MKNVKILERRQKKWNSIIFAGMVGFAIGFAFLQVFLSQNRGERGLGLIAISPLIIGFFMIVSIIISRLLAKDDTNADDSA